MSKSSKFWFSGYIFFVLITSSLAGIILGTKSQLLVVLPICLFLGGFLGWWRGQKDNKENYHE